MSGRWRVRRVAKWAGLGICVVIPAIWAASFRWDFYYFNKMFGIEIMLGEVSLSLKLHPNTAAIPILFRPPERGWDVDAMNIHLRMHMFRFRSPSLCRTAVGFYAQTQFWLPLSLAAVPTALLWYRDRRPKPGHCRKCDYDLTGNVSGICPECGEPIEAGEKPV